MGSIIDPFWYRRTDPDGANTLMLLPFDSNTDDVGPNLYTVTSTAGSAALTSTSKWGPNAAGFNSSGGTVDSYYRYLTTGHAVDACNVIRTGAMSIQFWMRADNNTQVSRRPFGIHSSAWTSGSIPFYLAFMDIGAGGTLTPSLCVSSTQTLVGNSVSKTLWGDGAFHFIEITKSGTSCKWFFDGLQQGSAVAVGATLNSADTLAVGNGSKNLTTRTFDGQIDDFRLLNAAPHFSVTSYSVPSGPFSYP